MLYDPLPRVSSRLESIRKRGKKERIFCDTLVHEYGWSYIRAAKQHLFGEDDLIHYSRLEDQSLQRKFADTIADNLLVRVTNRLAKKLAPGVDKLEVDAFGETSLLKGFCGITRYELRDMVSKYGPDFKLELYSDELVPQIVADLADKIFGAPDDERANLSEILKQHGYSLPGVLEKYGSESSSEKYGGHISIDIEGLKEISGEHEERIRALERKGKSH